MSIEHNFDVTFAAALAVKEKQIQQNYRPVIGVHKWFARRPGTLFRNLLLAEYNAGEDPQTAFFRSHKLGGVIADPFMGGGTPIIEANRLGFHVIGTDVNPMAYWIVRQELAALDLDEFATTARAIADDVDAQIGQYYRTECLQCGLDAVVKYFIWVKALECPNCAHVNELFPGYLLSAACRHPKNVLCCPGCGQLVETEILPGSAGAQQCPHCAHELRVAGPAKNGSVDCRSCGTKFAFPGKRDRPLDHRMWAIEYHCSHCKPDKDGRFFKRPSERDINRYVTAAQQAAGYSETTPDDPIPAGDETDRLHRWGYR